ncbi:hypothetical protein CAOG_00622 [Capsaspora owczarzaki ATCC 30864]|uniref:Uncharacterized protein n=1 Tax=Capsaspora owczarzaki (strain ATCC 30864) TaxID=595528 RepID=A0A0D2WHI0_CAPO3|nr:hypothetical protein CAOG_00622 [Capsaspora owczarzaki ATCC 30864]KJE89070.1 hypothetical protein CAOG_000622 [Capsaspora owczarzaki ATCC 30864]|eukprot:XP_004365493.1 hypothetical protein CAOG_00622 [Capsaspora owczarzaki ATCC 30864]
MASAASSEADKMDLYGDLEAPAQPSSSTASVGEATAATSSSSKLEYGMETYAEVYNRAEAAQRALEELRARFTVVESENKKLAQQNTALKKNISCLFNTAKAELKRQTLQLDQQQKDLDAHRQRQLAQRHRAPTHPPAATSGASSSIPPQEGARHS